MRVLLLSTYELGRQPLHLSSPAASLAGAGHTVRTVDLAVDQLSGSDVAWAEAVAVSVPMHTATRLASSTLGMIREMRPALPMAAYGLYAGLASPQVDLAIEGEYEGALLEWLVTGTTGMTRRLGRSDFEVPSRGGLPPLGSYAKLDLGDEMVLAGAVEASHGCRHRCRHCPVPAIYDGRIRIVPAAVVLADIDQLVAAGARHITFGDPDFLNAPRHTVRVLEEAHRLHPELTFDVTTKVSNILEHQDLLPGLAEKNLLFIVSAFESVDDRSLEILDKGHDVDDMVRTLELVRSAGIHIRPSWLPFMPWTTTAQIVALFRFIADNDLVAVTDPVQLAIRLLVPKGSLLEDHPALTQHLDGYDRDGLTWRWAFADGEVELVAKALEDAAARGSDCGEHFYETFASMWDAVATITGADLGLLPPPGGHVPRLTESWFCCAEPTEAQTVHVGIRPK